VAHSASAGSLFNHAPHLPNVSYTLDHATHSIRYTLMRAVSAGDELCISYGVGRMWWETDAPADDAASEPSEDELLRLSLDSDDEGDAGASKTQGISEANGHACASSAQVPLPAAEAASAAPAPSADPPQPETPRAVRKEAASNGAASASATSQLAPGAPSKLWRITTAIDPLHAPLETVPAWVVDVEPRKTAIFGQFLRRLQQHPHFTEHAPETTKHLRQFRRTSPRASDQHDGAAAGIQALIGTQRDLPERATLVALMDELNARDFTIAGAEPTPQLRDVPIDPAPCKARSAEWSALWPVGIRPSVNGSSSSVLPSGSTYNGLVDRDADAAAWNAENTEWARQAMLRCVGLARQAKAKGELPIAAFVTTPIQPPPWASTCPPATSGRIEAEAHDTRISERNPMKHAVTNAIKYVARIRVEREKERTRGLLAEDSPARTPSPTVSGLGADDAARQSSPNGRPKAASPSRAPVSNGQDYLLNSLALFTTHEPCMSCCMALVHSRVRSLYFLRAAPGAGGCCGALGRRCVGGEDGGPYVIQEQSGLNHRFDVWRWRGGLEHEGDEPELDALLHITGLDP
jgi:tRNA-specific adenosine deaminase 3